MIYEIGRFHFFVSQGKLSDEHNEAELFPKHGENREAARDRDHNSKLIEH